MRVNGAAAATTFNGAHLRIPASGDSMPARTRSPRIHGAHRAGRREHHPFPRRQRRQRLSLHAARAVGRERALSLLRSAGPQSASDVDVDRAGERGTRWRTASRNAWDTRGHILDLPFPRDDPLPTYLFAFAAGPWNEFTGGPRRHARSGCAPRARAKSRSIRSGAGRRRRSSSLENYFGVPYPFQQFQYMLSPAFPFGGMEHPGVTMLARHQLMS